MIRAEINFPCITRKPFAEPMNHKEMYGGLEYFSPDRALVVINSSLSLSKGQAALLTSHVLHGNTAVFGAEPDQPGVLGLDYHSYAKNPHIDEDLLRPVFQELADNTKDAHLLLGLMNSGAPIAEAVSLLSHKPALIVAKSKLENDNHVRQWNEDADRVKVAVPSFTNAGVTTVLSLPYDDYFTALNRIGDQFTANEIGICIVDDIIHTGAVNTATKVLIDGLQKRCNVSIKILCSLALFNMAYTEADQMINRELGFPARGIVNIKSLGMLPEPWFEVEGLEGKALTYVLNQK